MPEKKLSIIILTWNGEVVLEKNLDSIFRYFDNEKYELIIVDNGSTDNTLKIIENHPQRQQINLIKNKKNLGFATGNNVGIKQACGEYVLLLNQDVECLDDAMDKMLKFLENNPNYGAVAPQLLYPNGKIQISCRPFYGWKILLLELITFGRFKNKFYNHQISGEVDQPMASVLMIRGKLLKELGGFDQDPDFWLYFNDVDLSYRINQAGYKHYFLAEAQFYHHHGQSAYSLKNFQRTWLWQRGLHRFFLKHIIKSKWSIRYLALLILTGFSYVILNIKQITANLQIHCKSTNNKDK